MPKLIYEIFDLHIERDGENYSASVQGSGGGDARVTFSLADLQSGKPLPREQSETPLRSARNFTIEAGDTGIVSLHDRPPTFDAAKKVGSDLFKAVFNDEIYVALQRSRDRARLKKAMLRIRLNFSRVPELANLPWEYLYHPELSFYAQNINTPIVRYLEQGDPVEELVVNAPLRMLVMVASPSDYGTLNADAEWEKLKQALKPLEDASVLELVRLGKSTMRDLAQFLMRQLQDEPFHIFHFIGHGVFDEKSGEGKLLLEDSQGKGRAVSGEEIGAILGNHDTLRLAVLNACEGARISTSDPYVGVAQNLLRRAGIPAVVAMQYEITDQAAIAFAAQFYDAIANAYPVDAALSLARAAIYADGNKVEWATPVLYMRAGDGRLFIKPESEGGTESEPVIEHDAIDATSRGNQSGALPPGPLDSHYQAVVERFLDGQLVPFLGLDINLYGRQPDEDWAPGQTLPSSGELAAYLAREFDYPAGEPLNLISVSQYAVVKRRRVGPLYEALSRVFNIEVSPTGLHRFFARMAASTAQDKKLLRTTDPLRRRFLIVTTNYDHLLESAFENIVPNYHVLTYVVRSNQRGKFLHLTFAGRQEVGNRLIESPNDYKELAGEDPVILKLPGAVEANDARFAITEDHYADYLTYQNLADLLPPQLEGKLKRSSHLYLGYSLRGWSLRTLLYRIWQDQRSTYAESWAVHPDPPGLDEDFWDASDVEVIKADLKRYIDGLSARMPKQSNTGV